MVHMYVPHNYPSNLSPIISTASSSPIQPMMLSLRRHVYAKIKSAPRMRGIYFMMLVTIISTLSSEKVHEVCPLLKQKSIIAIF